MRFGYRQFSLKSLLMFALAVSIASQCGAIWWKSICKQEEAVASLRKLGFLVYYDYEIGENGNILTTNSYRGSQSLRMLLGEDAVSSPYAVVTTTRGFVDFGSINMDCSDSEQREDSLESLASLRHLRYVDLSGMRITDARLRFLSSLDELETLRLSSDEITEVGLASLPQLPKLKTLYIGEAGLSDQALQKLVRLTSLKKILISSLALNVSGITDRGVAELRVKLPKCEISLFRLGEGS